MNPKHWLSWVGPVLLVICLVALAQWRMNAWQASYGAYPDESSHFVGGLLVSDYLTSGWHSSPIQFARNYYLYQPYFAIGYWPPFYYVMEGFWMALFGHLRGSMMIYVGVISGAVGLLLFATVRRWAGSGWASLITATFLLLPSVQWSSSVVMTDMAVALLCLATTLAVGKYFDQADWRWALAAGILASIAMLTKYLATFALIAPVVLLVIDRRWDLLTKKQTWAMPLIVALFCGPWIWWSRQYLLIGVKGFKGSSYIDRVLEIIRVERQDFGLLLGSVALTASLWAYFHWRELSPLQRLLALHFPCMALFLLVGQTGIEPRYFMPVYPGVLAMIPLAAGSLGRRKSAMGLFAVILMVLLFTQRAPGRLPSGLVRQVAQDLIRETRPDSAIVLPTRLEGPFIAEISSAEANRSHRFLVRPSKILSRMTWLGTDYELLTPDPRSISDLFARYPLDTIILQAGSDGPLFPHDKLLEKMVSQEDLHWRLTKTYSDEHRDLLRVYTRDPVPHALANGILDLLDRMLTK